jgi:hypothetical protein
LTVRPEASRFKGEASEDRENQRMANRKGVFIGAYVPSELKRSLQQRAASEHRTLSQEITRILEEAVKGPRLPPNFVERRAPNQMPRRRNSDPLPRRRRDDLPYTGSDPAEE